MRRQRPEHLRWLQANGHDLAPLTGQDHRALAAIDACWELYSCSDEDGMDGALAAVRALLPAMQEKCWPLAKELIARAMYWGYRDRLWPEVTYRDKHVPESEKESK